MTVSGSLRHTSPFNVAFIFYDKEEGAAAENGLEDVLDAVPWLADSGLAFVLEPTDLQLELGCQGAMNATLTFSGKSAHSARPWLGENAVTKAGQWLAEMHLREPTVVEVADLAISAHTARFSHAEQRLGLAGNTFHLPTLIVKYGPKKARELLLFGDPFDGPEAERIGLVNKSVPDDELDATVEEWAHKVALNAKDALVMGKAAHNMALAALGLSGYIHAGMVGHALGIGHAPHHPASAQCALQPVSVEE